jgi:hypothetical protein
MQRVSHGSRLLRRWMLPVVVLVVAIAGFAGYPRPQRVDAAQLNAFTYCLGRSG